jgi:hypothetical protein
MESQGLFSNIHEWRKATNGKYVSGTYFNDALSYIILPKNWTVA